VRAPSGLKYHDAPSPHVTVDAPLTNPTEDPNIQIGSHTAGVLGYWFDLPVYLSPCPWKCGADDLEPTS
jgi:hypothetical protein